MIKKVKRQNGYYIYEFCRLLLNLSDKINLKRSGIYVALSNQTIHGKI